MTVQELTKLFNQSFGDRLDKPWPKTYDVDHETYANVCQSLFEWKAERVFVNNIKDDMKWIEISIGANNGIMFKNVELILKSRGMMK